MKNPFVRGLAVMIGGASAFFSVSQGGTWYLVLIALLFFFLAAFIRADSDDKTIFIIASGEVLVIAVGAASFWAGVIAQAAVIGVVLEDKGDMSDTRGRSFFALYCVAVFTGAFIFDLANQVLLPFLAGTAVVAAAAIIFAGVQEIQERRMYSGGK
jgi:hypothetical protein